MKILFLSRWFPYPPNNGSKIRILNVLKQLSRSHEVALLTFSEDTDRVDAETLGALEQYCSAVTVCTYREFRPRGRKALLGLLSPQPRYLVDTHSEELRQAVIGASLGWRPDLVVASQLAMVPYVSLLPDVPAILEELELAVYVDAFRLATSAAPRFRALLTWAKLRAYLRRVLPGFAACTVVSGQEEVHVRKAVPGYEGIRVVPNAVDFASYQGNFGLPSPKQLVFAGSLTYGANYDAVRYFLAEIYPMLRRASPGLTFLVTGSTAGVDLASLPSHPGVRFTGELADIRPIVAQSWASVVPLRIGGGTRLKVLESLALGTPVVATPKGAEGLDLTDGQDILVGHTPDLFADRVLAVLGSESLRRQLASNGREIVRSTYDWNVVGWQLRDLAAQVSATGSPPSLLQAAAGYGGGGKA